MIQPLTLDILRDAFHARRFHFSDEAELQAGIALMLMGMGIAFSREHDLGEAGRIDFYLTTHRIGIEVKAGRSGGGPSAVVRQVSGYARHPDLAALVIVSPRASLRALPRTLAGKPLLPIILLSNGL